MDAPSPMRPPRLSCAQNFEDVILWRALKHVGTGRYIDVGAQDPVIDSVSLVFYEQGWRGIHIEPNANYARKLRAARPDETVIEAAIGVQEGHIAFFEIPATGLSTGDADIAAGHEAQGYQVQRIKVPCLPFAKVLDGLDGQEIHWLKIDVEGMEGQVIASWPPALVRPWIVLVESTKPNSTEPSFAGWEPALLALGYEFVYFDGLNRFYVSLQHPELKAVFGPGPNIFDEFMPTSWAREAATAWLKAEVTRLEAESAAQQRALTARDAEIAGLNHRIADLSQAAGRLSDSLAQQTHALQQASESWHRAANALIAEIQARKAELLDMQRALDVARAELADASEARNAAARERDRLQREAAQAQRDIASRDAEITRLSARIAEMQAWDECALEHQAALERQLAEVLRSASWRISAPLRHAIRGTQWFVQGGSAWLQLRPGSRPHRTARRAVVLLARHVMARPALAARAQRLLAHTPRLKSRLRGIVQTAGTPAPAVPSVRIPIPLVPAPPAQQAAAEAPAPMPPDLGGEPDGVRDLYFRLRLARARAAGAPLDAAP